VVRAYTVDHWSAPIISTATVVDLEDYNYVVVEDSKGVGKAREIPSADDPMMYFHTFNAAKEFLLTKAEGKIMSAEKHLGNMKHYRQKARALKE